MPELPEVEHLRRSLEPAIIGARCVSVSIRRKSVITLADGSERNDAAYQHALLVGSTIHATHRRGKQMAIESSRATGGRVLVVQLGMTGGVTVEQSAEQSAAVRGMSARHRHVVWEIEPPNAPRGTRWKLAFRDPRRFGGLTAYPSLEALLAAWAELGPDALDIQPNRLIQALAKSRRPIKAALLDQSVIAGVGNIYADESLFAAHIHPLREGANLTSPEVTLLATELRRILSHAVAAGGSTLRDYRDAFGKAGTAVQVHAVYGREGQPCTRCSAPLLGIRLQGRATVFCPSCQDLSTRPTSLSRPR